ncbi:cation:proton antiporter [Lentzea sp. CC55]|uniref:cation:proton antiporter domain-containing protein n=1 Tax=Lentzea sp. CC55 TaxID=2884909 RepID=UPI001F26410E|nr:cation:proton antiporter [Lentzea sp. CC55]MCG8927614.1 cation:proton antiporter [Lentzea sp. CC55]
MIPVLLALSAAVLVRSLVSARLDRWNVAAPVVMIAAGALAAMASRGVDLLPLVNTEVAQHIAEIILAVLLFIDATEVRGGRLWGRYPGIVGRLLLVAMPLSIAAAMVAGALLLPGLSLPLLLLLACVVIPSDFAAAERVVRDPVLPARVRSVLNVESGYNDGLVSPVFLFALILSGTRYPERTPQEALATALPFALKAVLVGAALGAVLATVLFSAQRAGWSTERSRRVAVLAVPVLTYAATVAVDGNGFVASFVCGTVFRRVFQAKAIPLIRTATREDPDRRPVLAQDLRLLEDATGLLTHAMWFVVGAAAVVVFAQGVSWQEVVFCVAALTVLRIVPVVLSLAGTPMSGRDRFLVGALGPRGTTSIVFGLLAVNGLAEGEVADTILSVTVLCVLGSAVLHGLGSAPLARLLVRPRRRPEEPESPATAAGARVEPPLRRPTSSPVEGIHHRPDNEA